MKKVCVWDSTLKSLKNSTEATEKSNSKHTRDITQFGEIQEEDPWDYIWTWYDDIYDRHHVSFVWSVQTQC